METLFKKHQDRLINSFVNVPCLPQRYIFFRPSNFMLKDDVGKKSSILVYNNVKYRKIVDEDEELASQCNIHPELFKRIKRDVLPLYIKQNT